MHPEPSLETVLHALQALYHSPDASEKERASTWLEEFQKSVYAWTIADQLLAQKHNVESSYFAAQTMRTKIQHHFYELPTASHDSLKDSLLNHLSSCDVNTSPVVVTQLCLALADLALLMAKWSTAIHDLLNKFAPRPESYPTLLEILTVIPEEITSRHLRLGLNRKNELSTLLSQSFDGVHQFLLACLTNYHTDSNLCAKIFKCLASWFSIGSVPDSTIRQSHLLQAIFFYLNDTQGQSSIHEAATDCLCAALYKCDDLHNYGQLAQVLFDHVLTLNQAYVICAAQNDLDRCLNFTRIFTEMSESFTDALVRCPNKGLGSFNQLELICTTLENDSYEVAEISFNFWYNLSENIYGLNDKDLNEQFSPYVQRVILSLCKHIQLDNELEGILEKSDDFYDFRLRASDLIKDLVFIVGSCKVFREMSHHLQPTLIWNELESYLFVMASVASFVTPDDDTVVPHILDTLLTDYCNPPAKLHVALAYTCVVLIGELREWIECHTQKLDDVLRFLLICLRDSRLANTAAVSLDLVCVQCANMEKMIVNFPTILQVVKEVDSFSITSDATVRIIKAAAVILSKFPKEQLDAGIRELCSYQIMPLKQLVASSDTPSKVKRSTHNDPGFWLDRLTSVIRYGVPPISNGHHPCFQVVADLWSVLSDICNKYQSDVKTIEKCCRCIRFAIRNLGKSFTPLLSPLVTLMVHLYSTTYHSCYLYLGSILVDEFGSDHTCIQGLLDMTRALAQPTFELLSKPDGLISHPDTVDDFFRLALRFLQKDRLVLLSTHISMPLLKCAIAAATLQHRDANASVMRFFVEFLSLSPNDHSGEGKTKYMQVADLLKAEGQHLTDTLMQCCVSALPSMMMPDVADVFMALLDFDRTSVQTWLLNSLQHLPNQTAGGVVTATPQQLREFHENMTKSTDSRDIVPILKDFLLLYR